MVYGGYRTRVPVPVPAPVPVVRVCGMNPRIRPESTREGDFPKLQHQGDRDKERERSSCTAKEQSNLQYNGMQWDIVDHRCFIIYSFTIIGRGFCPFAL